MAVSRWGSEAFRQSCTAAGREALAMLRQATLLHRDLTSSPARPPGDDHRTDLVVLLHGLFATAGVLRPLRECIEAETGALTASFTYVPGTSVTALADRLSVLVRDVPGSPRIHLVGHSLGGIAVRWYVQELPLDPRIVQTICLASPFAGSRHARLMPGSSGRDLLPGSELLRRLAARAEQVDLPHLSLAAANDLLVEPGAWLASGERRVFPALGHNGMLYDREVIAEVVRRIRSVMEDAESGRRSRVRLIVGEGEGTARQAGAARESGWAESGWVSRTELERRLSDTTPRVSSRR